MDLIKGLKNGFFHTWETGNSAHRISVFKRDFKQYVDGGKFIRDIQNAPRDARYKIDHYYREDTNESDTVPFPNLMFHEKLLNFLEIDETFNWRKKLKNNKSEYTCGDFTIGYGVEKYYFKYKGTINTLMFMSRPEIVDYSDSFWSRYKDKQVFYDSVKDLLHNLRYFIEYNGIKMK